MNPVASDEPAHTVVDEGTFNRMREEELKAGRIWPVKVVGLWLPEQIIDVRIPSYSSAPDSVRQAVTEEQFRGLQQTTAGILAARLWFDRYRPRYGIQAAILRVEPFKGEIGASAPAPEASRAG